MRARKAQQAERGVIDAIKQRYVAQETNVKWDGFEPTKKTATEVNDETAYGSKNRPDFDQTLFDSDFRDNVIHQTATAPFNDFDWRKMDEVKRQMRINKCNIFCMDILWHRLSMAARVSKPSTRVPKLVEEFDDNGILVRSNRDAIEKQRRISEQWSSYGPMARRAYSEVNRLKNQMQERLDQFDIKIIDHTYAAC